MDTITRIDDYWGVDRVATSTYSYNGAGYLSGIDHTDGSGATTLIDDDFFWLEDGMLESMNSVSSFGQDDSVAYASGSYGLLDEYDASGNRNSTGHSTGADNLMLAAPTGTGMAGRSLLLVTPHPPCRAPSPLEGRGEKTERGRSAGEVGCFDSSHAVDASARTPVQAVCDRVFDPHSLFRPLEFLNAEDGPCRRWSGSGRNATQSRDTNGL